MDSAQLNWLTNFIWNIADDVLRSAYPDCKETLACAGSVDDSGRSDASDMSDSDPPPT